MDKKDNNGGITKEGLVHLHNDCIISKKQADEFKRLISELHPNTLNLDDMRISILTDEEKISKELFLKELEEFLHDEETVFMPKPDMIDRIYLCEEGLINCFRCIGKENCNQYRAKDRGLEE